MCEISPRDRNELINQWGAIPTQHKEKMKELLNYRYYILFALTGIALVLMLKPCEPNQDFFGWLAFHLSHKAVGVCVLFVIYKLLDKWNFENKIPIVTRIVTMVDKLIDNDD